MRLELTGPPPGVMAAGANEQAKSLGNSPHARAIELSKLPALGMAVMVTLPDPPDGIVSDAGSLLKLKVGVPVEPPAVVLDWHCDLNVTGPDIWLRIVGFPTA